MLAIPSSIRGFACEHDEVPAFHAAFLVATILSAAVFNLGFFAIVICMHMALDFVKYRDVHHMTMRKTCKAIFLESIGDIALLLFALTFSVYLSHTYVISAVSGILRSQLTLLRALGTLLPKIRIIENMLAISLNLHNYIHTTHSSLDGKMTRLEKWSLRTIIICTLLLIGAVIIYHNNQWDLIRVLQHELIPMI